RLRGRAVRARGRRVGVGERARRGHRVRRTRAGRFGGLVRRAARPYAPAAPNRIAPVLSPPASAIHVPVLPKRWNTGPIASRPSGAPSPLAVSTAVITFGRSVTGGRVVRMPMNGAFTIG